MKVPRTMVIAELRISEFELPYSIILFFSVKEIFNHVQLTHSLPGN